MLSAPGGRIISPGGDPLAKAVLNYGDGELTMHYDPAAFRLLTPNPPTRPLDAGELRDALRAPVDSPPLSELAGSARSALVVVSDATRIARADLILPILLEELHLGGLAPGRVKVIIALGNHRRATPEEIGSLLGETAGLLEVLQHDGRDPAGLVRFGRTGRGTEVRLNRLLAEHDLVIAVSMVNFHYFAGFTGGRKSIVPGLAARETIVDNHLLAIDFERGRLADGVEPGRLDGNPVHEDLEEAAAMAPPSFAVNVVLTPEREIGALFAGNWVAAHRRACDEYMRRYGVAVAARREVVIASCGGSPKDIDLIQSHKTIQLATRALEPGGTLVLLARCPEGFGSDQFQNFFPIGDSGAFLRRLHKNPSPNGQTALAAHAKAREFRIVLISDLPPTEVGEFGITPATNLDEALSNLGSHLDEEGIGYIVPQGAVTLPLVSR